MIKKVNMYKIVLILIISILLTIIIPSLFIKKKIEEFENNVKYDKFISNKYYFLTDLKELSKDFEESNKYRIYLKDEGNIVYDENIKIIIEIDDSIDVSNLTVKVNESVYKLKSNQDEIDIKVPTGKTKISISLYENDVMIKEELKYIYYIKPYEKQFLDEISPNGTIVHYLNGQWEKYEKTANLLVVLGARNVRTTFSWDEIETQKNTYNYEYYDKWIDLLKKNNINIIASFNRINKYTGMNKIIDNDSELEHFVKFAHDVESRYPFIKDYQFINEPNLSGYINDNDINWYDKVIQELGMDTIIGGVSDFPEVDTENQITSKTFYEKLFNIDKKINNVSLHIYDGINYDINNIKLKKRIYENVENFNNYGGFYNLYITEYGVHNTENYLSEEEQANRLVKQSIEFQKYNCKKNIQYNFWDVGNDKKNAEDNFGLITNDYLPKKSYYSMQKFYENTNGAEYIGQIDLAGGTEGYVYDKDGKPKFIVWSTDENKPVTIDYKDFDASDLYGKAIENTNGKLEITSSPVYLDNISANYFYQAISNSITDGYSEFKNKFKDEISKVNGLNEKIDNLSNEAKSIYSLSEVDENNANNLMKQHFELGNELLTAYKNGQLKIEYVKLSSMLDSLNTIGNSYEDLVTVSAKTRMTDLTEITNEVNKAKSLAEDNEQFDIVYPNKIYKFAQDLLDTSSYVLGLDEENDIKTGLINSKALHAKYLANWSQEFSKIYIKDALKTSTNSIIEKNETIKNNNKVIYENPNVKRSYDKLQNSIKTLIENPETNNVDVVYLNQINIAKTIMNEVIAKTINIQRYDYKKIICNILNISDDYRTLYNYYIKSDEIDRTQIKNNINKIINRYNDNLDISILSSETEMIKQVKDLYDNSTETDKISDNYLNKQRILQTCDIISQMLENDIKQHADKEFTQITKSSNHDLNKYTNQDEIITINLPNDKAKIADNNGENSITFSKNDSKTIKINIRGYEYDYKIEVTNIDKSYPTLNVQKEGTAITPNATDNNLDKITIMKDGKEIKYNIGSTITEPGIYDITAIDKAGNKVNTKSIVYGTFTNEQNVEEKYVPVLPGQKTQSIIENSEYSIANDKRQKSGNDLVATGDKLKTQNDTYIVITKGDITGSGKADIMSLIQLRKNIVGLKNFTKIQQLASDINSDGITNSIDLVGERKLIVGVE